MTCRSTTPFFSLNFAAAENGLSGWLRYAPLPPRNTHLVYLAPLWKSIFGLDLRVDNKTSLVRDTISGKRYDKPLTGYAGVSNVGTNTTWLRSHLAMSNLHAYGRMAWNPTADSEAVLQDRTELDVLAIIHGALKRRTCN